MLLSIYSVLAFLSLAFSLPASDSQNNPQSMPAPYWIAASQIPNASRSPCPLLNTLANQGFISRDGQNLTVNEITSGIVNATNIDPDFVLGFTQSAFAKLGVPLDGTIDLVDLDSHDVTEHDASITRLDAIQGETLTVQHGMVGDLLNDAPDDIEYLNTTSLGRTRARRESESQAVGSPPLSGDFENLALGEAGLVLLLLGTGDASNPDGIQASKRDVREWFDVERFPRGWEKSATVLTVADDLDPIVGRIVYWQQYWASQFSG